MVNKPRHNDSGVASEKNKMSVADRIKNRAKKAWEYYNTGVWQDSRRSFKVDLIKTVNLTMRGFMDGDLQNKACSMTYRTFLAIVPMLALLLAIGRGFGLQDYLQRELYSMFPTNGRVLDMSFKWVDSYLAQASEGIFVGVGILFLLWTLISLLSSVEAVFNGIWNVKTTRTMWRKVTDYIAILLILPVLLICSGGIQVVMSSTLQRLLDFEFLSPVVPIVLDFVSVVLSWLFFAGCYAWIPNAKVKFVNALIAGVLAGSGFQLLQWLFVSGQMYVAKYNAIYGSFSFLPLLLIWLQLVWLITFIGAGICYSSQNIFSFSFEKQVKEISTSYRLKVEIALLAVIVKRFKERLAPMTEAQLAESYGIPMALVSILVARLLDAGLVCHVVPADAHAGDVDDLPLQPSREPSAYRVGDLIKILDNHGASGFIPGFDTNFAAVDAIVADIETAISRGEPDVELSALEIILDPETTR